MKVDIQDDDFQRVIEEKPIEIKQIKVKSEGQKFKAKFRWWALICNFLYVMGAYFIQDNPAELQRPI